MQATGGGASERQGRRVPGAPGGAGRGRCGKPLLQVVHFLFLSWSSTNVPGDKGAEEASVPPK